MTDPIDLPAALARFDEPWSSRTVAMLNDYDIRVVRTKGEFTRHRHLETDEVFLVLSGSLTIRLDEDEVTLGPGQLYVVPRGVHHQPVSVDGADVVLIEASTTINTGDTPSHLTAERRLDGRRGEPGRRSLADKITTARHRLRQCPVVVRLPERRRQSCLPDAHQRRCTAPAAVVGALRDLPRRVGGDDLDEQQAYSRRRGQRAMRFTPRRVEMPPSNGPTAGRPDESQEEITKRTEPQQESPEGDGPAHPTGEHQAQENRENESPG